MDFLLKHKKSFLEIFRALYMENNSIKGERKYNDINKKSVKKYNVSDYIV